MKAVRVLTIALVLLALLAFSAFGAEDPKPKLDTGNTAWLLISTALVLLMTVPGLALFYGGLVRKKNILSTIGYSLGAAIIVTILWTVVQYSLAFSGDVGGVIGNLDKVMLKGASDPTALWGTTGIPESVFSMFQLMFAIITVALVSGAVVERMNFGAWVLFTVLWSLVVYTPLAHMVWGGGWLGAENGIGKLFGVPGANSLDYAGGLVVHTSSGISALVAALVLGPRVRYGKDPVIPNNISFTFMGASLLWVGWFGFNAGSALMANGAAGNAFMVTHISAAVAGAVWMLIEWLHHGKPTIVGASTGVVAGLVAITPAAGFVDPLGAMAIGLGVSLFCYLMIAFVKKAFKYDDSLDAFGVHGVGGIWGAIATGLFANPAIGTFANGKPAAGLFFGNASQLWIQLLSVGIAIAFAVLGTLLVLGIVRLVTKLRVEPQEEINGLDLVLHGERQE